jgi:hypothetical protein
MFVGYFFYGKSYVLIVTKSGSGYILVIVFTNSAGHSGLGWNTLRQIWPIGLTNVKLG